MKRHLKSLNLPVKLAVSISILAVLVLRIDGNIAADMIGHFKASAWSYASLFILLQFVLLSLRWKLLLNIGKRHLSMGQALQINLTSQLANLIFVTSISGMLARIALSVQHGASIFKSLIATALDRILTLCALLLLSTLFIPLLSDHIDNRIFKIFSTYISVFVVTVLVFAPLFLNIIVLRMPQTSKSKGWFRYGIRYLRILLSNPVLCGKLLLLSIAAQMGMFVAVFFLAKAAGATPGFFQLMTVLPMISLVASLPISVGGWGVREGAYVYGFGLLGVPMEIAFLISIQVGLIGMITMILAGIPTLIISDIKLDRFSFIKEKLASFKL